ncbi:MAG: DUF5640 domain-containing protein [Myxococcota bacterium]
MATSLQNTTPNRSLRGAEPMVKHFATVAVAALAVAAPKVDIGTTGGELAGAWAAKARTKGGLGTYLVLAPDGSAIRQFGALVDFQYRTEGTTLLLRLSSGNADADTEASSYKIVGDTLILDDGVPDNRQQLQRVGKAVRGQAAIVGTWTFTHYTGGQAFWQFTSAGLAQLRVPFTTSKGRFTVDRDEITFAFEGENKVTMPFALRDDVLTLVPGVPEYEQTFMRVRP